MYQDNFIRNAGIEINEEQISNNNLSEKTKKEIFSIERRLLMNSCIKENIQMLKRRKRFLETVMFVIIFLWIFLFIGLTNVFAQFHPTDVSDLSFFVESSTIDENLHIANCNSNFCLNHPNSESAIISEQYCDTDNSCSEGCVRRWIDQSSYMPAGGFNPPEFANGRNFGQDDAEKACYISNCINGKPCVRGGGAYGGFSQDKYLEIEGADVINLPNDFSIFLLAKPIDQSATGDWFYFGQASHYARHRVSNNTMILNVGNNGSPQTTITTPGAIQINQWQLIEIHRDNSNNITTFINGVETSVVGSNTGSGNFKIGYLLSVFKTGTSNGVVSMHGDVAGFLVYNKKTDAIENGDIRSYFFTNYINTLDNEMIEEVEPIKIYSNPTHNLISILNPEEIEIHNILIYDMLGRLVKKEKLDNRFQTNIKVDISTLDDANYTIQIEASTNNIFKRIIKY